MANTGWSDNVVNTVKEIEKQAKNDGGRVVGIAVFVKFGDSSEDSVIEPGERIDTYLASHHFPHDQTLWEILSTAVFDAVEAMKGVKSPNELLS